MKEHARFIDVHDGLPIQKGNTAFGPTTVTTGTEKPCAKPSIKSINITTQVVHVYMTIADCGGAPLPGFGSMCITPCYV
jgi:hypothetical protein